MTDYEKSIKDRVDKANRFSSAETIVKNPEDSEYEVAIQNAIDDINLKPPYSNLTIADFNGNPMLTALLVKGTTVHILNTIIASWVSDGTEVSIDELTEIDRLDRYEQMRDNAKEDFENKISELKASGAIGGNSIRVKAIKSSLKMPVSRVGRTQSSNW